MEPPLHPKAAQGAGGERSVNVAQSASRTIRFFCRRSTVVVPMQFCFTPHRQPMDAIEATRSQLRKGRGWGHGLLLASPDVEKASGQLEAREIKDDVRQRTPRHGAISAVLHERVDQHPWLAVVGVRCESSVGLGHVPNRARAAPPPCGITSQALSPASSAKHGKACRQLIGARNSTDGLFSEHATPTSLPTS